MAMTWVLVADTGNARIFGSIEDSAGLSEVISFARPGEEREVDKKSSKKKGSVHDKAVDYFVKVIAHALELGSDSRQLDRIVLVAPRKFLDHLNLHLDSKVFDRIVGEVPHDLIDLSANALQARLSRLFPSEIAA